MSWIELVLVSHRLVTATFDLGGDAKLQWALHFGANAEVVLEEAFRHFGHCIELFNA